MRLRHVRAEEPHFAGAGDVNQIGLEPLQGIGDEREVAQKRRIEAQIFLKREGEKASRQLECPDVAVFDQSPGPITRAHAKERKIAPPREGLKVAAGVGDSVDFVEGVGKVRDAGRGSEHKSSRVSGVATNVFSNSAGAAHHACSAVLL